MIHINELKKPLVYQLNNCRIVQEIKEFDELNKSFYKVWPELKELRDKVLAQIQEQNTKPGVNKESQKRYNSRKYRVNGEDLTMNEILDKYPVSVFKIRQRVRDFGMTIHEAINYVPPPVKSEQIHVINGKETTIKKEAEKLGIAYKSLMQRMRKNNIPLEVAITLYK